MLSLKQRLSFGLAASLAFFFVMQTLMIGNEVEALTESNLVSRLQHDQEQLLSALQWNPPAAAVVDEQLVPSIYRRAFSGHYFQIDLADQSLRSRSLWDEQLPASTQTLMRDVPGPKGQLLLVLSQQVELHGQQLEIRVAEDISPIEASTRAFQRHLLLFAAATVLALMVLQGWLINHGLKPLQRISRQLKQLDGGELEQITAPVPEEIIPLVDEINHLVQLMRKRLQRSRHALGDLAHSLKTPLAVVLQMAQRQQLETQKDELIAQLQLINQRIDNELARARAAGPMPGGQWKHPEQDLHEMCRMLKHAFPHISITLQLDEGLNIGADREDMLEIMGNLLENGCKWARSSLLCSMHSEQNMLLISVEDDGPGQQEAVHADLLHRGSRADESKDGHGLGLAIVNDLVSAYNGRIELSRSTALHGFKVSISMPCMRSASVKVRD
ncbi:MAG: ATP-binding protein [Mariprofundus sp.]|nr:ATP-binding protein [Mariprofundus sp.]